MPELWTLCITLSPIKVYPYMEFHFISISRTDVIVQTSKSDKENKIKKITSKILMPELQILYMTLSLIKIYIYIKFHFNSISRTGVIAK